MINTAGLVLIGPGSEWFWTAVSGLVLAVTFIAIYRQLKLQRDAAAIEATAQDERMWTSERMSRSKLAVLEALAANVPPLEIPDKAATHVGDFYERMGYLTRTGHLDRRVVHEQWGPLIRRWWGWLAPNAAATREHEQFAGIWSDFEWLATTMAEIDRRSGTGPSVDPDSLGRQLPISINQMRDAVAIDTELRTVIVRFESTPLPVVQVREPRRSATPRSARNHANN